MNSEIWDVLIIGGGPGGLAAGIYSKRAKLKTLLLEKGSLGGQAATTEELENYPGFRMGSKGSDIARAMKEHALDFNLQIEKDEVVCLEADGEIKVIKTKRGNCYYSHTVILALGARPNQLGIKGEQEFIGKGVSYCATCDAHFFEDLDVVVVGNGDTAIEEALYLTKFANQVTIIIRRGLDELGCNKISAQKALSNPKIAWMENSAAQEITGDGIVESLTVKNLITGELSKFQTNGVFVFIGNVPNTAIITGLIDLDARGWVITDEYMQTSVPGIFAAGDARQKVLRQVVTAVSDGAIAAVGAQKYLEEQLDFKQVVLEKEHPVLAIFWTPENEASCHMRAKVEDLVACMDAEVETALIDIHKKQWIKDKYNVGQLPAVLLFKQGKVVGSWSDPNSIRDIKEAVCS